MRPVGGVGRCPPPPVINVMSFQDICLMGLWKWFNASSGIDFTCIQYHHIAVLTVVNVVFTLV